MHGAQKSVWLSAVAKCTETWLVELVLPAARNTSRGTHPSYYGIMSARPDVTWPISRHWEELTSWSADEEINMDLVATIVERNGHLQWEERVQFIKDFRMSRRDGSCLCRRSTIDQIVQQEWIGAG